METKAQSCRERIHACPVETSIELLSGKWKPRILWKLYTQETVRFGELRQQMPEITAKMLTQQLRELESDALVARTVYAEIPPRVEYRLSDFGKTLGPVLDSLAQWGVSHHTTIIQTLKSEDPA